MSIHSLPRDMRPREKMQNLGPGALTDAELLALLLRTGTAGKSVLHLSQELLEQFRGISGLLYAGVDQLKTVKGLGFAKCSEILAVVELMRRLLKQQLQAKPVLNDTQIVKDYLHLHLHGLPHEVFVVLFLDAHYHLICMEELFQGSVSHTIVYPRQVVKRALHHNASHVVLAHNHPSGPPIASQQDETLTLALAKALDLVEVRVLDHLIVAQQEVVSMYEMGFRW